MGYYSTISGKVCFDKTIGGIAKEKLVALLEEDWSPYSLGWDDRSIEAPEGEIKCYFWCEYMYEALRILDEAGIRTHGQLERVGEEADDCERLTLFGKNQFTVTKGEVKFLAKNRRVYEHDKNWRKNQ